VSGGGTDLEQAIDQAVPDRLGLSDWTEAALIVLAAIVLAVIVRQLVLRLDRRADSQSYAVRVLARFASFAIVTAGVLYAFAALEIRLTPLLAGLGVLGVVIAFATKDLTANYVAGLLIGIRRPFRIGDEVESQGNEGVVEDLNLRYTTVRAYDNTRVLLPNAGVFGNPLINRTVNEYRRSDVALEVTHDTDLSRARRLIEEAMSAVNGVMASPPPIARAEDFADSSVVIRFYFWHAPSKIEELTVRDEVVEAVLATCRQNGIKIATPQRDVRFRDADPGRGKSPR